MRQKTVAANWKMYKNPQETRSFCESLRKLLPIHMEKNVHIFPQSICIETLKVALASTNIKVGAQNCYFENEGAFTGEVSPQTLFTIGCSSVLVGHSERRNLFSETNETCRKKILKAQEHKLLPLYCIGETLQERKESRTFEVLEKQLTEGLQNVDLSKIIIAYEPVWAIGTGEVATPEIAQEAHEFIRNTLKRLGTHDVTILYGGSVKPENAAALNSQPDIDGFLVGGASLKADSFAEICKTCLTR